MADGRHLEKSKHEVLMAIINSQLTSSSAVADKPARRIASRLTAKF